MMHKGPSKSEQVDFCLRAVPLFRGIEPEQLGTMQSIIRYRFFRKGKLLYRVGEPAQFLYVVHRGLVRVYRLANTGKEQLIRILRPGDFAGELALFKKDNYEAYAEVMEDSDICMIQFDDFRDILVRSPVLLLNFLTEMAERLATSEQQATWITTESVRSRISRYLVHSGTTKKGAATKGNRKVCVPMNKKQLASYLGTTPESLSRQLAGLEASGLIREISNREFELLKPDVLRVL